jgi:CubicO group peptidase (beta-lactamase class C family)
MKTLPGTLILLWATTAGASNPAAQLDPMLAAFGGAHAPGCAVSVIDRGKPVYQRAVGLSDLERETPLSTRSVFDIGSTSKQFTAMSVVLLVQDGKLAFDDDVRKWIPELPVSKKKITLSHLLHHTSGIRDYTALLGAAGNTLEDPLGDDPTLAMLARQRSVEFPAGTRFNYSNSNYFLLSIVVKRAAGMPLSEFARRRIFEPLAMKETHIHVDHERIVPRRALSYDPRPDGTFVLANSNWEQSGDGAVHTTVDDLARWDENFYTGKVGGADAIRLLTTPGKLDDGKPIKYALGLFVDTQRGLPTVSHGGAWGGYRSELLRFPTQHLSVIVLCNRGDSQPMEWAAGIADAFLPAKLAPEERVAAKPVGAKPVAADVAALAGTYVNEVDGDVRRYAARDGRLVLEFAGGPSFPLEAVGPREFHVEGNPNSRIHRFEPAGGPPARMRLVDPDGTTLVFERARPPRAQLAEYSGGYYSDELDALYQLAVDGKRLFARVRDRAPFAGEAVADDLFSFRDGLVRFERDAKGRVTAMRWLLPGGGIRFVRR